MLNKEIVLASRYRLIESLGKGAFGKTYLADDTLLPGQPQCVVKQLNPQIGNGEYLNIARRLFKQEAEALHKLGHWDKIPTLYAYFEQDTEFYLVQQYIPGNTLSQELIPGSVWQEKKVIQLLEEVLHILNFIHFKSVIHRDIKPSNLIRRQSDKKLVLVDFGAVKEVVVSQTNIAANPTIGIGTKGYMSAEQIRGKPRFNSDIYSLGVIGIQALTGINPNKFIEDENGEIIWKNQVNVSTRLIEIISNMTRYHFQERYQSAAEVLEDLEADFSEILTMDNSREYITSQPISDKDDTCLDRPIQDTTIKIDSFNNKVDLNKSTFVKYFFWNKINNKYLMPILAVLIAAISVPIVYTINYDGYQRKQWVERSLKRFNFTSAEQKKYRQCLEESYVETGQKQKIRLKEKEQILANCKLTLATKLAEAGNYFRAIEITLELANTGFYNNLEIQKITEAWYLGIIQQATTIYQQEGDLEKASNLLHKIPENATVKLQTSELITQWSIESEISKNLLEEGKKAIVDRKWQQAKSRAEEVLRVTKSQPRHAEAQKIITIAKEKIAKQLLDRARIAISEQNWKEARRLAGEIKKNGNSKYLVEAEQIIKTTSQKISELEGKDLKQVVQCEPGLKCSQLF